MTQKKDVVSYRDTHKLTDDFFEEINDSGFSRLPIFKGDTEKIAGILYAKDLIVEDEEISIKDTEEALDVKFITVREADFLDSVLLKMIKLRRHLAIVENAKEEFVGIISMEDIIEEIIQQEIVDEDDRE